MRARRAITFGQLATLHLRGRRAWRHPLHAVFRSGDEKGLGLGIGGGGQTATDHRKQVLAVTVPEAVPSRRLRVRAEPERQDRRAEHMVNSRPFPQVAEGAGGEPREKTSFRARPVGGFCHNSPSGWDVGAEPRP